MLDVMQEALMAGRKAEVETLVDQAIAAGLPTRQILNEGLIAGMEKLGVLFKNNEVFIPEVLVAARAMNAALAKLEPLLIKEGIEPKGCVVIGTVKGDLHDIGKNLVAMMLKGAGFKIVDLGADVSPDQFVDGGQNPQSRRRGSLGPVDDDDGSDEIGDHRPSDGRCGHSRDRRRRAAHLRIRRPDRGQGVCPGRGQRRGHRPPAHGLKNQILIA